MSENKEMIYRSDVIKALCTDCAGNGIGPCEQHTCTEIEIILDIPSVRPEPGWHKFRGVQNKKTGFRELAQPLPEEGQNILISVNYANHQEVQADIWHDGDGECWLESGYNIGIEAVAWMAFPEPYTRKKGGFL
jgi:hypothetical protein